MFDLRQIVFDEKLSRTVDESFGGCRNGVDPCSEEVRRLLRPTLPDGACASLFVAPVERPPPALRGIADAQAAPPAYEYCRTQPGLVLSSPLVENVSPSQPPLSLFRNAAMLAPHTSDVNEHTYGSERIHLNVNWSLQFTDEARD